MPAAKLRAALQRARTRVAAGVRRLRPRHLLLANVVVWSIVALLWHRCGIAGCPNVERLASYQPGGATVLLDRNGQEFADLSPIDHDVVALDALPEHVPGAFLAVEDKRFYEHGGVDVRRVGGALLANAGARSVVQGFSTITMQLARNVWPETLPGRERTLQRKVLEIRVAREIERKFTKNEILELYLNNIYFGSGAWGIDAAARNYFGKPASELRLSEAALLAAMPKSPVLYNPRRYPERALARRNLVLELMAEQERVSEESAAESSDVPLRVRRDPPARRDGEERVAPWFTEAVRRVLEDRLGEDVYTTRLVVHTTLDPALQRIAARQLERQLDRIESGHYGAYDGDRYTGGPPESTRYLQGAVVMIEAASGDVLALVGGRDYSHSQFDRATRARRQAGSAFKPFVYAAALQQGFAASQHILDDTLRMELEGGEVWEPVNYGGTFRGFITLRESLVESRNIPAIRLAQDVGLANIERLARRAGIRSDVPDVPSAAIGSGAVTPLELTAAYTSFANLGTAVRPRLVDHVIDGVGAVVWQSEIEEEDVLDPAVAYIVTDMLRETVDQGTGRAVRQVGFGAAAAGKTGTTNDGADVWFVGYTPDLVAGVWMGFDVPEPIIEGANGGQLAAPLWGRLMDAVYEKRPTPPEWTAPERVVELPVDPATGLVLVEGCRPERGAAITELFVAGDEPASVCPAGTPARESRGLLARLGSWLERTWQRALHVLARHIGSEDERPIPPRTEERYIGTPRLPRAVEVADPIVPADSFRPRVRIFIPALDSIQRPDSLPRDTLRVITDSILLPPAAPPDTAAPSVDSVRVDTITVDTTTAADTLAH
ncbi:MAG TPA: PBP1A family penicillin-binding protein [Longimicrobiales bacterium]|nr:PBP1A family penicillin-binding protein [Longimicrobiales bacterium]